VYPASKLDGKTVRKGNDMGALCTKADGSDYDPTEEQDNFTDKYLYASDVEELELAFAALKLGPTQKVIRLASGTYQLTEQMLLDDADLSGCWIECQSGDAVLVGPAAADAVKVLFAAATLSSTFEFGFRGLRVESATDFNAFHIDNTDAGKKVNIYMDNVGAEGNGTGKAIITTHGDTSNAIRVYAWGGLNADFNDISFVGNNNGDRLIMHDCSIEDTFVSNDQATLAEFTFVGCQLPHEGFSGGNAAQYINSIGCYTKTSGIAAAADTNDFAGSQSEVITP